MIAEQPDWLSLMIGINDVWRAFGGGDPHHAVIALAFLRAVGFEL